MGLTEFSENVLVLTEIFAIKYDIGRYEKVFFAFDKVNFLTVDVDWGTDEVIITFDKILNRDEGCVPILPSFYGFTFIRSWLMVNHKGYQDAIQLEFWDKNKETKFLQIQAVASHLNIYELNLI